MLPGKGWQVLPNRRKSGPAGPNSALHNPPNLGQLRLALEQKEPSARPQTGQT